jgi:hypothetical protein
MKKAIIIISFLVFASAVKAQPRYVYVTYFAKDSIVYISKVFDLKMLSCDTVSQPGAFNQMSVIYYFIGCAKKWFQAKLISNGVSDDYINSIQVYASNYTVTGVDINCRLDYGEVCFIFNPYKLERIRQEFINSEKPKPYIKKVITVD